MKRLHRRGNYRTSYRSGFAYVLALILLTLFTTLSLAFMSETNLNLQKSENTRLVLGAQLAAESGVNFMNYLLKNCRVRSNIRGQSLLDTVASELSSKLNGSPNVQGASVGYDNTVITIPEISLGTGQTFSGELYLVDDLTVRLIVTGTEGSIKRSIGMDYQPVFGKGGVFNYGLASKGVIRIIGNARIQGANSVDEASILSTTYSN
ncbi:MAG: hypothetical protein J7L99_01925, partial [Planctomycetes bacterium]|nr:hypothetical protein [Planctomycetota bacterium]